jgi:hypothetical protein
MLIKRRG